MTRALAALAATALALPVLAGCGSPGAYQAVCVDQVTGMRLPDQHCTGGYGAGPGWIYYAAGARYPGIGASYRAPGYTHYSTTVVNHTTVIHQGAPATAGTVTTTSLTKEPTLSKAAAAKAPAAQLTRAATVRAAVKAKAQRLKAAAAQKVAAAKAKVSGSKPAALRGSTSHAGRH